MHNIRRFLPEIQFKIYMIGDEKNLISVDKRTCQKMACKRYEFIMVENITLFYFLRNSYRLTIKFAFFRFVKAVDSLNFFF